MAEAEAPISSISCKTVFGLSRNDFNINFLVSPFGLRFMLDRGLFARWRNTRSLVGFGRGPIWS